ncbi:hypothetical protein [Halobacillus sp. BBL2006]|uniref:hypothetical protein n=1 Tax=Halobacillus sp. BBL2006 TaxID=1543706 RepID=UPI000542DBF0|nr:hypothetical protein [Halobacillus sp. BBL2006]KHE67455.1 hypothetical protein LD39_17450 [Halobacillus sp. BBL2006]
MHFLKIFKSYYKKNEEIELLKQKVASMHEELKSLQKQETINNPRPIYIVEKLNVERVRFDKFELHNNFGALGIKEMKGRLNIGANYGHHLPNDAEELLAKKDLELDEARAMKNRGIEEAENHPKVNIKPKS